MAALAPRRHELLWDIGAGAGSIAIEWMLADPSLGAIAIEARPDRAARILHAVGGLVLDRRPRRLLDERLGEPAALDHESGFDAVKDRAGIKAFPYVPRKVVDGNRRLFLEQFDRDVASAKIRDLLTRARLAVP